MESRLNYRNPTFSGLSPVARFNTKLSGELSDQILDALQLSGTLYQLDGNPKKHTLFRLSCRGASDQFIKIVPQSRKEITDRANGITTWLYKKGIPVVNDTHRPPVQFQNESWIYCCTYLRPREVPYDVKNLSLLGAQLATLHSALNQHPDKAIWEAKTQKRIQHLKQVRASLLQDKKYDNDKFFKLREIAADTELDFSWGITPAIALHGDLNPGNILMSHQSDRFMFIDFEDTSHSVLPREYDLAYIIERMILIRQDSDDIAQDYITAFLGSYQENGGILAPNLVSNFPIIMKSLNLRSLCTLCDLEKNDIQVIKSEWNKFYYLYNINNLRSHVFKKIKP